MKMKFFAAPANLLVLLTEEKVFNCISKQKSPISSSDIWKDIFKEHQISIDYNSTTKSSLTHKVNEICKNLMKEDRIYKPDFFKNNFAVKNKSYEPAKAIVVPTKDTLVAPETNQPEFNMLPEFNHSEFEALPESYQLLDAKIYNVLVDAENMSPDLKDKLRILINDYATMKKRKNLCHSDLQWFNKQLMDIKEAHASNTEASNFNKSMEL